MIVTWNCKGKDYFPYNKTVDGVKYVYFLHFKDIKKIDFNNNNGTIYEAVDTHYFSGTEYKNFLIWLQLFGFIYN